MSKRKIPDRELALVDAPATFEIELLDLIDRGLVEVLDDDDGEARVTITDDGRRALAENCRGRS